MTPLSPPEGDLIHSLKALGDALLQETGSGIRYWRTVLVLSYGRLLIWRAPRYDCACKAKQLLIVM